MLVNMYVNLTQSSAPNDWLVPSLGQLNTTLLLQITQGQSYYVRVAWIKATDEKEDIFTNPVNGHVRGTDVLS